MKVCPKCESEHDKPGTFCSRKCANSRIFSEEAKRKKSQANKGRASWSKGLTKDDSDRILAQSQSIRQNWRKRVSARAQEILVTDFDTLSNPEKRKRILHEQNGGCLHCGTSSTWNGCHLTLELDHINGVREDNSRGNLRILCPNCHSQTPTYRAKNRKDRNLSAL